MSNYTVTFTWFTSADAVENNGTDVIIHSDNIFQDPITVITEPNTGTIQIQVKGSDGEWFTPDLPEFSNQSQNKSLMFVGRKNMPETRVLATGNAKFALIGPL